MSDGQFGISGFSMFVPPYRVKLQAWCDWTGNSWDKTRAVIGNSFRVVGPEHSVYTMSANAVLKLILDHDLDPRKVGYLALGTESSIDNATSGAIIVRGLVDQALVARGMPALARDIEAPEFKQACIGGVYGIKGALRYLATDGASRTAIVVAADIAEYARGSTGEPTQGAGAVAMLLERNPKLLAIDLKGAASATSYRAVDFRKPFLRYTGQAPGDGRLRDFPIFNGKYSTACYIEETMSSLDTFFKKRNVGRGEYIRRLGAVFMHRPYHKMPVAAWTLGYLFALGADGEAGREELSKYALAAKLDVDQLIAEMNSAPDLIGRALAGDLVDEPFPLCAQLSKVFRDSEIYRTVVDGKMKLGAAVMMELGNLYSASLPAWVASGLEEAAAKGLALEGKDILMIGYGSGDSSEVLPARVVPGWEKVAPRFFSIGALGDGLDIGRDQYEALHDGRKAPNLTPPNVMGFVVDRIGTETSAKFQDYGIEYYRYSEG
jgi:hydroxymethylglutaryl-CoA synthase